MLVDLALSTGLRVSELVALKIQDIDLKRGSMKVVRLKRKKKKTETMAIGSDLIEHLREYLEWDDRTKGPLFVGQRGPLPQYAITTV
jgi:integrase/recombinase XerD